MITFPLQNILEINSRHLSKENSAKIKTKPIAKQFWAACSCGRTMDLGMNLQLCSKTLSKSLTANLTS